MRFILSALILLVLAGAGSLGAYTLAQDDDTQVTRDCFYERGQQGIVLESYQVDCDSDEPIDGEQPLSAEKSR